MEKVIINNYLAFIILLFMIGCSYTIPREMSFRESLCPPDSTAIRPDLAIIGIASIRYYTPGVTVEHHPTMVTMFTVSVSNIGKSIYAGPLELSIVDKPADVKPTKHDPYSRKHNYNLNVGDTTRVRVTYYGWYATGVRFRFKLHTDPNCIECNPVCELSYNNNYIEYSIP